MNRHRRTALQNPNFQGLVVLVLVVGIAVFLLLQNDQPAQRFARPVAATATASNEPAWRVVLGTQVYDIHTLTPTPTDAPTSAFVPLTPIGGFDITPQIVQVTQIRVNPLPTLTPIPTNLLTATIEFRGPTPIPSPTGFNPGAFSNEAIAGFQPPGADVPLSLQPYDHFYFRRPVNASANSRSIYYYPYGGRWPGDETIIHHGVDMPNPIGELVYAGANGRVIWAGRSDEDIKIDGTEIYVAYGNFVIIAHDFTTAEGLPIWTLYAHLSAILVQQDTYVKIGDRIGLVGNTGLVTGPHVHFEVRVGNNNYAGTRNPLLWIAPFVGHGVVAGRVVDGADNFIEDANITLYQGGQVVDRTVSYATNIIGGRKVYHINPDNNWRENFAMGDIPPGQYQLVVVAAGRRLQKTITVNPELVNFFVFEVNPPESTPVPQEAALSGNAN